MTTLRTLKAFWIGKLGSLHIGLVRAIHRACDKAGIDRWGPNRLRHAAATEVRKEFGLEGAQIILGHASADVSQVYAERDIAKGLEIARKIG